MREKICFKFDGGSISGCESVERRLLYNICMRPFNLSISPVLPSLFEPDVVIGDWHQASITTQRLAMAHSDIILKIPERFDNALKTGDLRFFPSTMAKLAELDMEVSRIFDSIYASCMTNSAVRNPHMPCASAQAHASCSSGGRW